MKILRIVEVHAEKEEEKANNLPKNFLNFNGQKFWEHMFS